MQFAIMLFFLLEWAAKTWAEPGYALSFFFFTDLVASVSMILDALNCFAANGECPLLPTAGGLSGLVQSLQQTTRLARILRLLRVLRIVKLATMLRSRSSWEAADGAGPGGEPSTVGKKLHDKVVRTVITTVIVIFVVVPFLEYAEADFSDVNGLRMVALARASAAFPDMLRDYESRIEHYSHRYSYPTSLLAVRLFDAGGEGLGGAGSTTVLLKDSSDVDYSLDAGATFGGCFHTVRDATLGCPAALEHAMRCSHVKTVTVGVCREDAASGEVDWSLCRAMAVFDAKRRVMAEAVVGICTQVFIALLLFASFQLYSADVNTLVVKPIESMVDMVRKLAKNPNLQLEASSKTKFETDSVRIALSKIVGLMQLGFGGAGHEIIAANLAEGGGRDLDLMRRGRRLECAYGFCDIRQFTDTVECLQDQVMLFTNSVGEYVHHACDDNRGEPNKNIGDAFLIVWRNPSSATISRAAHTKTCDGALTAFRRCVREIASSSTLKLVTDVPAIHKKFGRGKYKTKIGFGLHFGWSVEGPVGTPSKIDCSYLSPEVKIADRLEAATKIYAVNILMTGQFYDFLSEHMKVGIRLVDHVSLKGGHKPFRIYGCDRCNLWLKMNAQLLEIYGAEKAYEHFSTMYHEGMDSFIRGDWRAAHEKLEGAQDFCPGDMPTQLLLRCMRERSTDPSTPTAPADWKGYHASEV